MKSFVILLAALIFVSFFHIYSAEASDAIEVAGDVGQAAVPLAALLMTYAHKDKEGVIEFAEAYATSTAVTEGLKYTIHERRPNGGSHSFPSGHTSSAFAGAAYIQQRYGWEYGIPAYLAASFVGYSRVESRKHHFGDVVAGAAVGVIPNLIFTKPFKNLTISPSVSNNYTGIMIRKNF